MLPSFFQNRSNYYIHLPAQWSGKLSLEYKGSKGGAMAPLLSWLSLLSSWFEHIISVGWWSAQLTWSTPVQKRWILKSYSAWTCRATFRLKRGWGCRLHFNTPNCILNLIRDWSNICFNDVCHKLCLNHCMYLTWIKHETLVRFLIIGELGKYRQIKNFPI